ncbi:stage V sporulation protein AA [Alteribacillus persepolensis]|uniref:Stage V sporulation protein AA n=1 Tax=Alteribacillus persepolensis TaxID=568899 RepID=A0A1G7ZNN9_9BACI|nr:stage V sporulation protein AA [Alteribacillus persepolensis]SDH10245.1 stage V sporulation protein AA [Alteribacillus persepolensis]
MPQKIYMQLYAGITAQEGQDIYLKDVARLEGEENELASLMNLRLYRLSRKDKTHVVLDLLTILREIHTEYPDIDLVVIGPEQTVVEIEIKKKVISPLMLVFVWFLLFIGAALAIMNFHEDVSMLQVHQKLYALITGTELEQPLLLQIPYSIGLGLGMILFFNHVFKKRINEEPSPLEIEMFHYQKDIEKYISDTESDRSSKSWQSKHYSQSSSD